jgi:hypothetical protein
VFGAEGKIAIVHWQVYNPFVRSVMEIYYGIQRYFKELY